MHAWIFLVPREREHVTKRTRTRKKSKIITTTHRKKEVKTKEQEYVTTVIWIDDVETRRKFIAPDGK